ncbi:MAG: potassium channel protein [bacterium]|nr:potassium channel protein [bacterium]
MCIFDGMWHMIMGHRLFVHLRTFLSDYFRFLIPLLIVTGLMIIGTVGYMRIDNYSLFDAFYMTVITIGTVGYGEVHPLSEAGRIFTSFLIITSFATFAFAITSISKFVVDGELNQLFKKRQLNATLDKLKNHVIICGFGRNGRQAAQVLKAYNKSYVVIEREGESSESIGEQALSLIIKGDATQDEMLIKAGIHRAKALITTLPSDSANLFIVLTARNLNAGLLIISRASDDSSDKKLKIAGANNVIMPDKVGGAHMASLVTRPDVMEFLDFITMHNKSAVNLEEISFKKIAENWKDKTLGDIAKLNVSGANIVGYKSAEGDFALNPNPEIVLRQNSKLFVLGNQEQVKQLKLILQL